MNKIHWRERGIQDYDFDINCLNNMDSNDERKYFILQTLMNSMIDDPLLIQITNSYFWNKYIRYKLGYDNLIDNKNVVNATQIYKLLDENKVVFTWSRIQKLIQLSPQYANHFIKYAINGKNMLSLSLQKFTHSLVDRLLHIKLERKEDEYIFSTQTVDYLINQKQYTNLLFYVTNIEIYEKVIVETFTDPYEYLDALAKVIKDVFDTSNKKDQSQLYHFSDSILRFMLNYGNIKDIIDSLTFVSIPTQYIQHVVRTFQ